MTKHSDGVKQRGGWPRSRARLEQAVDARNALPMLALTPVSLVRIALKDSLLRF